MTDERLAIDGGTPARLRPAPSMYPGGNLVGEEEAEATLELLRARRLYRYSGAERGPSRVAELEQAFASRVGTRHALAVTSGTAALMCALAAVGLDPGDEVILPAYTWIASATAVVLSGGIPILAEVDESLTLDPDDAAHKITPRTRALLPVHMRGAPANMEALQGLARSKGLALVEDVAQADGASYRGRPLGGLGDAGCFSLQFNKIITAGEGGMVTTSDERLYKRALMFHDPGSARRLGYTSGEGLPGMNFRMPELLGAVALAQLAKLDGLLAEMRARKAALKGGMAGALAEAGGCFRRLHDAEGDAAVALVFYLPSEAQANWVVRALNAENISAAVMYRPDEVDLHVYCFWEAIMAQRTWTAHGGPWRWGTPVTYHHDMCPRTLDLLGRAVHMDVNPLDTMEDIDQTVAGLNKVLRAVIRAG